MHESRDFGSKLVSVIIPFYSRVDWLCEAVQSVLEQTYDKIEIIVVNDGSPEDVNEFLKRYGDKIIYRYKVNGGAATARNLAMDLASGEYFAFLDSDDIWLPTKTAKQVSLMEECGAMWSHTGFYYWKYNSNELSIVDNQDNYGDIRKKFLVSTKIATPSVIVKRDLVKEEPYLKFPEEYRTGQDVKFFQSISDLYKIALLKEPLVKVRMRGDNTYKRVIVRFNSRAKEFTKVYDNPDNPIFVKSIFFIYYIYSKIFGKRETKLKNFIGSIFLVLPYTMERLYTKKINREIRSDISNEAFIR